MTLRVRPARPEDVPAIVALVAAYARRGDLLPRTEEDIRASLDSWLVAEEQGVVLGCGSLVAYSPELLELRSLAVDESAQGRGVGMALTRALIEEARRRGARTLFALTRAVPFFERAGFRLTEMARFPEKVWRDCRLCPFLHNCDETAMVLELRPGGEESQPEGVPYASLRRS